MRAVWTAAATREEAVDDDEGGTVVVADLRLRNKSVLRTRDKRHFSTKNIEQTFFLDDYGRSGPPSCSLLLPPAMPAMPTP